MRKESMPQCEKGADRARACLGYGTSAYRAIDFPRATRVTARAHAHPTGYSLKVGTVQGKK
jgi:hypothetical protein